VLNEIVNVARRKMRMSWKETHGFLEMLRDLLPVVPVTVETHEAGSRRRSATGFRSTTP
jgi:predicted nucleic acid-binding protein